MIGDKLRTAPWLALLPGGLTIYLGYNGGGYFAGATGIAVAILTIALVLRLTLAQRPLEGLGPAGAATAGLIGLFAVWALVSTSWSDSPARAIEEFDRALLYLLAFLLIATLPREARTVRWLVAGLAVAAVVICAGGLLTRLLPETFPTSQSVLRERLAYPVTYWNGLGLVAALGLVLATHLTSAEREHPAIRIVAAALLPVLAATLYFTFSRASIAVAIFGLVAYMLIARPRGLLPGALAALPLSLVVVKWCYEAGDLAKPNPTTPAAVDQGQEVALVLLLCALGAAALRLLLIRVGADERLAAIRVSRRASRTAFGVGAGVAAIALVVAFTAFDLGGRIADQYDGFKEGDRVKPTGDARDRLTAIGNNGRLYHWEEAIDAWETDRLKGTGAGTYELTWAENRPSDFIVRDGHSLYLEVLSELGLVGAILLALALAAMIVALVLRVRGQERTSWAALLVCALVWALHAAQDWDWELPVVTLGVFAAGGMALARPSGGVNLPRFGRVVASLFVLVLAVTPLAAAISYGHVRDSLSALNRGNCDAAIDSALQSTSTMAPRPEPYAILAFCDVRLGKTDLALRMAQNAVDRDPNNWIYRYGLGLVRGAAKQDPRSAIREARRLNPKEELAQEAERAFDTNDPQTWRRRALEARLPFK